MVQIRTPNKGDLVIQGERPWRWPVMCSVVRARHYFHQGCAGFVAYVMDTQDKAKAIMDNVPIGWEYLNVFPEHLPGVPP